MAEERVWVEIETHKNTQNTVSTFRGTLARHDLDALLNETYTKKWVTLHSVYWNEKEICDEQGVLVINAVLGSEVGQYAHHTGEMHIIASSIVLIYHLHGGDGRHPIITYDNVTQGEPVFGSDDSLNH